MPIACFLNPTVGIGHERARHADLRDRPLALTSDDTIIAVSDETAPFGIRPGQSGSGARVLCPDIRILPYDRSAYKQAVQPLWDLFARESSVVDPISPEICFVELIGRSLTERVRFLARESSVLAGVPVFAGLARTKFVAKQAARQAGADAVLVVPGGQEAEFLAPVSIVQIPGLDQKRWQQMERLGIHTLGDLQKLSHHDLLRQFNKAGFRLRRLALGEDGERMRPLWPPRRHEEEIVFEYEVIEKEVIHEALHRCADGISRRLTGANEYSRSLELSMSLADGSTLQQREKHASPVNDTCRIHGSSLRLLGRMEIKQPVIGVRFRAADIDCASARQLALLDLNDSGTGLPHERKAALDATLDYLGKRYGSQAVLPARAYHRPRRISLWTDSLGRMVDKPLTVKTDSRGAPVTFCWRGREQRVEHVLDRWKEEEWTGGGERAARTVYLVQTASHPFSELIESDEGWKLGHRFD